MLQRRSRAEPGSTCGDSSRAADLRDQPDGTVRGGTVVLVGDRDWTATTHGAAARARGGVARSLREVQQDLERPAVGGGHETTDAGVRDVPVREWDRDVREDIDLYPRALICTALTYTVAVPLLPLEGWAVIVTVSAVDPAV